MLGIQQKEKKKKSSLLPLLKSKVYKINYKKNYKLQLYITKHCKKSSTQVNNL